MRRGELVIGRLLKTWAAMLLLMGAVFVMGTSRKNSTFSLITNATENAHRSLADTRDWLERFSQQLRKAFLQYSHADTIRQTLLDAADEADFEIPANDEAARSEQFLRASEIVSQRLDAFFASKRQAIKTLAHKAEMISREFDNDNVPNGAAPQSEMELCNKLQRAINATTLYENDTVENTIAANVYERVRNTSSVATTVHVALNEYRCHPKILGDFAWTANAHLIGTMRDNLARDLTIARQYIASYNGLTRVFPAFKWNVLPRDYTIDLFDSRFRPWFTAAESAPRDVLFLIDFSGSMRGMKLHITKTLIQHILVTLSPNDFFSGVWYNSRRDLVLADCLPRRHGTVGAHFLPATTRNKRLFQRYLDRVEDHDQATLPAALNLSFTQFLHNSRSDANGGAWERERKTSGGHKVILLFSDGVEFWPVEVVRQFQDLYPEDKIRVFGYSMGRSRSRLLVLDWLMCATGGNINSGNFDAPTVGAIAEVRPRSRLYIRKLSEILALSYRNRSITDRPITWTTPYMDAQRLGAVISLSMPLLDWASLLPYRSTSFSANWTQKPARFRAVVGIDFAVDELHALFGEFGMPQIATFETNVEGNGGATIYAFLVDNNGIVHYHPRQRLPKTETYAVRRTACHRMGKMHRNSNTRLQYGRADEHVHRIMGSLDSIPMVDMMELEYRPSTAFRKFREKIIAGECTKEHGHNIKDETQKREYRCYHVADTPFTVAFVRAEQLTRPRPVSQHPLHRLSSLSLLTAFRDDAQKLRDTGEQVVVLSRRAATDPLGYWLHDARALARMCDTNAPAELNAVERTHRFYALMLMIADGRCRMAEVSRSVDIAQHYTFLQDDALSANALSLLSGADALLQRWRDIWPSTFLPRRRAKNDNITTVTVRSITAESHSHRRRRDWQLEKKKESVACTLHGIRYVLPRAFDARYFLSAFVDLPAASITAFFPKCRELNLSSVIDAYLPHASLSPLTKSERVKLRVDVARPATASDTLDNMASVVPTLVVAEKLHRISDAAHVDVMATVGAQFAPHFLHDKFQRSLNATGVGGVKSWPECQIANRRCYLLTTSAYVVASTAFHFPSIVHLSVVEPQIFEHLIKGDVIQKTTWTDYQADCSVTATGGADPLSVRKQLEFQRRLLDSFFGEENNDDSAEKKLEENDDDSNANTEAGAKNTARPTAKSTTSDATSTRCLIAQPLRLCDVMRLILQLPALWYNAYARMEALFGIFADFAIFDGIATSDTEFADESDEYDTYERDGVVVPACDYGSNIDAATLSRERCVVEHTLYTLRARQTLSVKSVHYRIGCNSDLIIIPSTSVQLHLLILDEKCDNFPTIPTAHRFMPYRVADCSLTNTRSRRLRSDLDYTRTHPDELYSNCPSAARRVVVHLLAAILVAASQLAIACRPSTQL